MKKKLLYCGLLLITHSQRHHTHFTMRAMPNYLSLNKELGGAEGKKKKTQ